MRRLSHTPALDGLRAIAVLLVVVVHLPDVDPRLSRHVPRGFLGVDIFFVLSGFLITAILLRENDAGGVRFGAFYRRRALRLFPALLALVFAYALYAAVTHLDRPVAATLWSMVFYYSNWRAVYGGAHAAAPPGLGHMWSLAIEEQFYLVWPVLLALFFGMRQRLYSAVAVLTVAIVAIAIYRAVLYSDGTTWLYLYVRTDTRADSLLVGALLAILWVRRKTPTRYLGVAGCCAAAVFAWCLRMNANNPFFFKGGYTIVAICAATVLLAVLECRWFAKPFEFAPLRAVGKVSYGLYLWHFPVFAAVFRYGRGIPGGMRVILALSLAAAFTLASWFLIERPFLRLKDGFEARSRASKPSTKTPDPNERIRTPTKKDLDPAEHVRRELERLGAPRFAADTSDPPSV
jgi:peptidoglycan/LPS O-acetylase OafA/YrhL